MKNPPKHEAYELKQMQSLPLHEKVAMSKRRIRDWYEKYDGQVCVSFSGGKDSTVLLHLVRSMYPEVPAVFSDTGLEYPEIREFVKTFDNVVWLKPKMNFKQVILKYGYPIPSKEVANTIYYAKKGCKTKLEKALGISINKKTGNVSSYNMSERWKFLMDAPFEISDRCCSVMKKIPFKAYATSSGQKPFIGTMAEESRMRLHAWMRTGCNAYDTTPPHSTPIAFWTQNDVLHYIVENHIPIASVYGEIIETGESVNQCGHIVPVYKTTGCDRTGCMFCMFGITSDSYPNRFQRMSLTHPKLYEYCMKPIDQGGLGLDEVLTYCGIPHNDLKKEKQLDIFDIMDIE